MGLSNITGGHHIAGIEISYIQWTLSLSLHRLSPWTGLTICFWNTCFSFVNKYVTFPFSQFRKPWFSLEYVCLTTCVFPSTFAWAWQNTQQNDALEAHIICKCSHQWLRMHAQRMPIIALWLLFSAPPNESLSRYVPGIYIYPKKVCRIKQLLSILNLTICCWCLYV